MRPWADVGWATGAPIVLPAEKALPTITRPGRYLVQSPSVTVGYILGPGLVGEVVKASTSGEVEIEVRQATPPK